MNHRSSFPPPPMSSSRQRFHTIDSHISYKSDRQKFLSKQILPAIVGNSCPICLNHIEHRRAAVITACMHAYCIDCIRKWSDLKRNCPLCNSNFDSWFFGISFSSRSFYEQKLPPFDKVQRFNNGDSFGRRRDRLNDREVIRRSRAALNLSNGRSKTLPVQRSFGAPASVPPDIVKERILQWRASIYEHRLQALPCGTRDSSMRAYCQEKNIKAKEGIKERILQRIEPWILRELQALTGIIDPSIIVHLVTSLFIPSLEEEKHEGLSGQSGAEDKYLQPLHRFLFENTNVFWHELRCFAESSLNMDTYDKVVQYIQRND